MSSRTTYTCDNCGKDSDSPMPTITLALESWGAGRMGDYCSKLCAKAIMERFYDEVGLKTASPGPNYARDLLAKQNAEDLRSWQATS